MLIICKNGSSKLCDRQAAKAQVSSKSFISDFTVFVGAFEAQAHADHPNLGGHGLPTVTTRWYPKANNDEDVTTNKAQ